MPTVDTQRQLRRGTSAEHTPFTGALGELTYNTTTKRVHIHDGVTPGGIPLQPFIALLADIEVAYTQADKDKLDGMASNAQANAVDSVDGRLGAVVLSDLYEPRGEGPLNWLLPTVAGVLARNKKHFVRIEDTFQLEDPVGRNDGEFTIVAAGPTTDVTITVIGGSQIITAQGSDTTVILLAGTRAEFLIANEQWEV